VHSNDCLGQFGLTIALHAGDDQNLTLVNFETNVIEDLGA